MNHAPLLVAIPLLAAFLLPLACRLVGKVWAADLGRAVMLIQLVLGVLLWREVLAGGPLSVALGGFAPPLGIAFYADHLAVLFALAVAGSAMLLWPRDSEDPVRESVLTLVLVAGGSGLCLSADLFNLFVFYELVAVASYGLAATRATGPAFGAALRFLVLSALGSAFALLGIGLIYAAAGTLNLADLAQRAPDTLGGAVGLSAFLFIAIGFGVKAELFPVNTWVPEVYGAASSRVAGLLAGVVSKLALLLVLRVLLLAYTDTAAPMLLLTLGLLSVLSGELAAYRAEDLRRMLAYSSIGQLGLVAIAFSVPNSAGVLAGLALAFHHLLVKPALFLLTESWGGKVDGLNGAAGASAIGGGLFLLCALSLIGIPPLPGFWAKFLLLKALFGSGGWYALSAAVVLVATVVEAAYLLRVVQRLYRREPAAVAPPATRELAPAMVLGAMLVLAALAIEPLGDGLDAVARETANTALYVHTVLP